MAQKIGKTVSLVYLSLITPFLLQSLPALALPSPIRPRHDSRVPLLELCVDTDAPLVSGKVVVGVKAGLPSCWTYSPFPSTTRPAVVPFPTNSQASQPILTITIPVASGSILQQAQQAVGPTNGVEVQAKDGQVTQRKGGTHHISEEETFITTFVVPDHQQATPTIPLLSGGATAHVLSLEGGASPSGPHVDRPSEATSSRDSPSQAGLPQGARVALGIAIPVALTGIVALGWMFYRRQSQHPNSVPADVAAELGTDKENKGACQPPPYPPPCNIQRPEGDLEKMDVLVLSVARLSSQTPNRSSKMVSEPSTSVSGHIRQPSLDAHEPIIQALGFAAIDRAPPLVCAQPTLVRKGIINFSRPLKALKSPTSTRAIKLPPTPKLIPKLLRTPKTPNISLSLPRTTVHYPGNRQAVATTGSYKTPYKNPVITNSRSSPQGMVLYSTGESSPSPKADHLDPGRQSVTCESIIAAYGANTDPSTPKKRLTSFKADLSPSRLLGRRTTLSPIISLFSPKLGSSLAFPEVPKMPIKPLHPHNNKIVKLLPAALSRASRVDDNDPGFSQFVQGFLANNEAYHVKRTRAIQEAEEKENPPVLRDNFDEDPTSGLGPLLPPLSLGLNLMAGSSSSTLPSLMSDSGSAFEVDRRI